MILCLDFDGVIHSYTSGWQGAAVVIDPPVPGAIEFITEAVKHFDVHVHSSRSHAVGGRGAMASALVRWGLPYEVLEKISWPTNKPSAFVTLDDRALTFTGQWPDMETLKAFKPWNKK